jgi:hypothetical protein
MLFAYSLRIRVFSFECEIYTMSFSDSKLNRVFSC